MLSRSAGVAPRPCRSPSSTYQSHAADRADRSSWRCAAAPDRARCAASSSNVVTASPVHVRSRDSSATAACGSATRDECSHRRCGPREQFARRRGDDAERAFRADEQIAQVVAGVVLAQRLEAIEHAAVGQHDFEAEHEVAHHAVAQDRGAAGVGRQIAAELAGAFRAEAHRKQPIDRRRCRLHLRQHAAGFGDHRVVERIDACGCAACAPATARSASRRRSASRHRSNWYCRRRARRRCRASLHSLHDGGDLLGAIRAAAPAASRRDTACDDRRGTVRHRSADRDSRAVRPSRAGDPAIRSVDAHRAAHLRQRPVRRLCGERIECCAIDDSGRRRLSASRRMQAKR